MSDFLHIKRVFIPNEELQRVYSFLRQAGTKGVEAVALLAGRAYGEEFVVKSAIIPRQTSFQLEEGLLYAVEGAELHRINVWLHQNKLSLIAQIHTHPGEAYHSDTDDRYPIVDTHGSISLVVPDFAQRPMRLEEWATFRSTVIGRWVELNSEETCDLIQLT